MRISTVIFSLVFTFASKSHAASIADVYHDRMGILGMVVIVLVALFIFSAIAGGVYSLFTCLFEDVENTLEYWQGRLKRKKI